MHDTRFKIEDIKWIPINTFGNEHLSPPPLMLPLKGEETNKDKG